MLSPRGSGREPTGYDGRRARGAEGQRNSAPVLLLLGESELARSKKWAWLKLAARPVRREYRCDVSSAPLPTLDLPEPRLATTPHEKRG